MTDTVNYFTGYPVVKYGKGKDAWESACIRGDLEYIKYFHKSCLPDFSSKVMDLAAGNGHLDIVKWLHENRTEGCTTLAIDWAAKNGHLDIVKWLYENVDICKGGSCNIAKGAINNGHLDIVKWIHENIKEGILYDDDAIYIASCYGYIEVVKFLCENRKEYRDRRDWIKGAIFNASMNGYTKCCKVSIFIEHLYNM